MSTSLIRSNSLDDFKDTNSPSRLKTPTLKRKITEEPSNLSSKKRKTTGVDAKPNSTAKSQSQMTKYAKTRKIIKPAHKLLLEYPSIRSPVKKTYQPGDFVTLEQSEGKNIYRIVHIINGTKFHAKRFVLRPEWSSNPLEMFEDGSCTIEKQLTDIKVIISTIKICSPPLEH